MTQVISLQPITIGLAHRKIVSAMERLQNRIPNRGLNFKQIGIEAGGYSYTHTRRLIMDLICAGKVDWLPGVANSIRLKDQTAPPKPPPKVAALDELDWS